MAKHASFGPSRLKRIILCPGSVQLCEAHILKYGETTNASAIQGSHRHGLTDHALMNGISSIKNKCHDDDDYSLVSECIDFNDSLLLAAGPNVLTCTEEKVSLEKWGIPEVWGTLDRGIYDTDRLELDVIDWKFGYNIVDAFENPQLMAYAAGLASKYEARALKKIRCHIFQPTRDYHSIYELTPHELFQWVHGTLALAINEAKRGGPLKPSEEACQWCDIRSICKARYQLAQEAAGYLFDMQIKYRDGVIAPDVLAESYALWTPLAEFMKDIYKYGLTELNSGRTFPGFKMVRGRANRRWTDEQRAAEWCMSRGMDDIFNSKFKSASQLEKIDKSLKKNEEFQKLITKPPGKLTMVPDSDRREPVEPESSVEATFEQYKVTN